MTRPIWEPDPRRAADSAIAGFARRAEAEHGVVLPDYPALHAWSVEHLADFWRGVWTFFDVAPDAPQDVLTSNGMPGATWFPGVRLNYVARVFAGRDPDDVAVVAVDEGATATELTWSALQQQVAALQATLQDLGVRTGDRVVGYLPNGIPALVGFLATAGLGAIWSCCAPDYAAAAAANRLAQLDPVVLICADGTRFAGREHDRRDEAVRLAALMPTVRHVVSVRRPGRETPGFGVPTTDWETACAPRGTALTATPVPFDHPLWVLYSSGTTGVPKGLVHGHGGVVLDGLKVCGLHLDLGPGDRLFWYTSTNWMMWNFTVSGLLVGASIVLYDGSPAHPAPDRLWQLAAEHGVTVLGTSPGYLQACEKQDVRPDADHDLRRLRLIGATGSPLSAASSRWVDAQFGGRVPLVSTSGGTDVVSALAFWAPTVPIWPGEISCAALGVAIDAFDDDGRPVRDRVGELVVTAPMPTMPVMLWNDPDGSKYRATYFDTYPGLWRHGDWVTITGRGSVVFHGRSDATLNRNGVRLGSADIYDVVDALPGVRDSLVVGLDREDGGYWMPLFVVADDLDDDLRGQIVAALRREASPRHVPDEIIGVRAVPRTRTGKKLEVPVKRILLGAEVEDVLSLGAVEDPSALDDFVALARELRRRSA
ncbi:acetoacetate--CoA ligase [Jatrophihabitans fulvus]